MRCVNSYYLFCIRGTQPRGERGGGGRGGAGGRHTTPSPCGGSPNLVSKRVCSTGRGYNNKIKKSTSGLRLCPRVTRSCSFHIRGYTPSETQSIIHFILSCKLNYYFYFMRWIPPHQVSQLASGVFVVSPGAVSAHTTRVGSFSALRTNKYKKTSFLNIIRL